MLVARRGLSQNDLLRTSISQSAHKRGSPENWIVHFSSNPRLGQRCPKTEQLSGRPLPNSGQVSRSSVSSIALTGAATRRHPAPRRVSFESATVATARVPYLVFNPARVNPHGSTFHPGSTRLTRHSP